MAVQEQISTVGASRTYPTTKPIASKSHMEVQIHDALVGGWNIVDISDYDLIANACVFIQDFDFAGYDMINVRVADTPNELVTALSAVAIVAGIASEVVTVAGLEDEVVILANIETEIIATAGMEAQIRDVTSDPLRQSIIDGDVNAGRAEIAADEAEASALEAENSANEIKDVGVVSPVTSVPLLPNNVTGVPTVTYDPIAGDFTYGIPVGKTGEPAQVVTPVGAITVAGLNALVTDPILGAGYWLLDTGTVTYGDPDCVVTEVNSVLVWLADGYFFNLGILSVGNSWGNIVDVTVDLAAPQVGDSVARTGSSYTKLEQDAIDTIQDNAIALNTAKVSYKDTMTFDGTTLTITIG